MADLNKIIELYIKVRDKMKEMSDAHEKAMEPFKTMMERVEVYLLSVMQETNQEAVKCSAGTAYVSTKTSATLADRDVFFQFAMDRNLQELLDIRAAKVPIAAYKAAHGDIPPGVTWREEKTVNVRRS